MQTSESNVVEFSRPIEVEEVEMTAEVERLFRKMGFLKEDQNEDGRKDNHVEGVHLRGDED